jgi:TPP-dependent indolepyruvate ferredoxin oxidoreductase alpha subunit
MKKDGALDLGNLGRIRLSGNQAVARGALEAGVRVATGYPGAPISDLQGSFEQLAGNLTRATPFAIKLGQALDDAQYQLTAHWGTTTNEDNAFAFALGACSFKHLGGNTAADAIRVAVNVVPYTGGLGIASGDDRQGTASQTMQDNKVLFSLHFRMPTFELHSPLTAHQTVKNCYRLFEELGTPFAVIMNYDLSYREVSVDLAMDVDLGANMRRKGFTRDPKHLVTIGPHIRPREHNFHSKLIPLFRKKIGEYFDFLGNKVQQYGEKPRTLLLLNGPFREDFQLVKHDRNLKNRLLKKFGGIVAVETTVVFPQPESLYKKLITKLSIEKICVFEEGYGRVIYMQLLDLVNRHGLDAKVFDCGIPYEPRIYERFSYIDHILAP